MSGFGTTDVGSPPKAKHHERRQRPRARIAQTVRVRSTSSARKPFEEVCTTKNVSREGLYFTASRDSYWPGQSVCITWPYTPAVPSHPVDERLAEVLRVDKLTSRLRGVAIQFVTGPRINF